MLARPKHVWVGFLEAQEFLAASGWVAVFVEVSGEAAATLAGAMKNMGVPCAVDKSRDVVAGRLDDVRRCCSACGDGQGRHLCDECASAVLVQRLELSVGGGA